MKKNLLKIFALSALMTAFVACSDDDNNGGGSGNEIAGTYVPTTKELVNPDINNGEPTPFNFMIDIKWKKDAQIPTVGYLPASTVVALMNSVMSQLVSGGLQEMTLAPNGSISAKYKDLVMKGTSMSDIMASLIQPEFGTEIKNFPSAETDAKLPADAVAYESSEAVKMIYFKLSKKFINDAAAQNMGPDFSSKLETMISSNNLPIKSEPGYFGIPLKYRVIDNKMEIYTDRSMVEPYIPMLKIMKDVMPPVEVMGMTINVPELLLNIIEASESLDVIFPLEKK